MLKLLTQFCECAHAARRSHSKLPVKMADSRHIATYLFSTRFQYKYCRLFRLFKHSCSDFFQGITKSEISRTNIPPATIHTTFTCPWNATHTIVLGIFLVGDDAMRFGVNREILLKKVKTSPTVEKPIEVGVKGLDCITS